MLQLLRLFLRRSAFSGWRGGELERFEFWRRYLSRGNVTAGGGFTLLAAGAGGLKYMSPDEDLFASARVNDSDSIVKLAKLIDVNQRHEMGWKAIHVAAVNSNYEAMQALVEAGAELNAKDEFSNIFDFADRRRTTSLEVMSRRENEFYDGFHIHSNAMTFSGCTALHYAVFVNDARMVKLLLDSGADPTIENDMGHPPVDYVRTDELRAILKKGNKQQRETEEKLRREERRKFPLRQRLKTRIVGQEGAINVVSQAIKRWEGGWRDEGKPLVFLFLGSSGIGKTELAKQVADYLGRNDFIRMDMSEYQHQHEVAKFIGSPPGYVGYEEGGQLTKRLTKSPQAVVLFDEVEKAHPDVLTVLLQLFDEGRLTDGQGKTTDCPGAIFVMTSNLASEEIARYGKELRESTDGVRVSRRFKERVVRPILKRAFRRDEFLGRINEIVYFLPFSKSELMQLVEREIQQWMSRAKERFNIDCEYERAVLDVLSAAYNIHYGARSIKHEVDRRLVSLLASAHDAELIGSGDRVRIAVTALPRSLQVPGTDDAIDDEISLKLQKRIKSMLGTEYWEDVDIKEEA